MIQPFVLFIPEAFTIAREDTYYLVNVPCTDKALVSSMLFNAFKNKKGKGKRGKGGFCEYLSFGLVDVNLK